MNKEKKVPGQRDQPVPVGAKERPGGPGVSVPRARLPRPEHAPPPRPRGPSRLTDSGKPRAEGAFLVGDFRHLCWHQREDDVPLVVPRNFSLSLGSLAYLEMNMGES